MTWTPELVEKLKCMWKSPARGSAATIAVELKLTRSQVLGKLHRLGMLRTNEQKPSAFKRRSYIKPNKGVVPVVKRVAGDDCQWITGDVRIPGWTKCGKRVAPSKPYCLAHCKKAYIPKCESVSGKPDVEDRSLDLG